MDEGELIGAVERGRNCEIPIRLVEFGGKPSAEERTFVDGDGDAVLAQYAAQQNRWVFGWFPNYP